MDSDRFDRLSRAMTRPGSRRSALAALVAGALASALAPSVEVDAKKRKKRKKRKSGNPAPACSPIGQPCGSGGCCGGATCQGAVCRCPDGMGRCGDRCVGPDGCAAGHACDKSAAVDVCPGASTCTGQNASGQKVCCGIDRVHGCEFGPQACCSGECGFVGFGGRILCGRAA